MDWNRELEKCRNSFSNYFLVGGRKKSKTIFNEKEINEMWNNYKRNKYDTKS